MTPERSEEEWCAIGKRLGIALAEFVARHLECRLMQDEVLAQVAVEKCREELEWAAQAGLEAPWGWLTLAKAITEPDERLQTLLRALRSLEEEFKVTPPRQATEWWEQSVVRGETLYELGLLHAAAGRTGAAQDSFEKALSCAHSLRAFRPLITGPPPEYEDQLEGKIAAASLMLDTPE